MYDLYRMYEIEMNCYRGIKYDAKTLKSNAKKSKAKKSNVVTYRGITGKIAA